MTTRRETDEEFAIRNRLVLWADGERWVVYTTPQTKKEGPRAKDAFAVADTVREALRAARDILENRMMVRLEE